MQSSVFLGKDMSDPVKVQKVKLLTYYLPLKKVEHIPKNRLEKLSSELKEAALKQVIKVFEGSTFVRADAKTEKWGDELTTIFNVVAFESSNLRRNAEILGWLLLNTLDAFKKKLRQGPEEIFWFTEHEITLYEIKNPEYEKMKQRVEGSHNIVTN
jgi:hypothetical protein